jgi:hypothetical protein
MSVRYICLHKNWPQRAIFKRDFVPMYGKNIYINAGFCTYIWEKYIHMYA